MAPSLCRSAWPVHASCPHACVPGLDPSPALHPHPRARRAGGLGCRRKPSPGHGGPRGVGEIRGRGGQSRVGAIGDQCLGFSVSASASCPPLTPDTLPVLGPGHQPDHAAPWAGGQSVPGAWPAWLPTPQAPVGGQAWAADILPGRGRGQGRQGWEEVGETRWTSRWLCVHKRCMNFPSDPRWSRDLRSLLLTLPSWVFGRPRAPGSRRADGAAIRPPLLPAEAGPAGPREEGGAAARALARGRC